MNEEFILTHPSVFGTFSAGCYYGCAAYLFIHQLILKRNRLQQWLLWLFAVLFVVNNICMFNYYGVNVFGDRLYYDTNMLQLMMVPGITLLICEAVKPRCITWPLIGLCVFPFAAIWALSAFVDVRLMEQIDEAFTLLFIIGASVWGFKAIRRYHENLLAQYSNIEDRDLWWLTIIIGEILLLLLVWMLADYFTCDVGNALYNIVSCLIWYTLAFFVNRQKIIKIEEGKSDELRVKSDECRYHFADRLKTLIEDERRYLDSDLCLHDLAVRLNTNRTYISQYLNNECGMTFYDYVNSLRIQHAARLLLETDDKIEVVAMESGFNNSSTFRRLFCKQMGCSASDYRRGRVTSDE